MDLREYFNRIGFTSQNVKADLDNLFTIHKLHVTNIAFENLSLHSGEKNSMDLNIIYDKIIKRRRGGWCCENNLLFSWVLKEMGYKYTILGSRVFSLQKQMFSPVETHLINLVNIDEKRYIADVSFGLSCQIWYPLELISGKEHPQPPGVFRLLCDSEIWILERTGRKPLVLNEAFANCSLIDKERTRSVYCFSLSPRVVEDFLETSENLQTNPDSQFLLKSICSIQMPTGFRGLVGWTYFDVTFKQDSDLVNIRDVPESEIESVLSEKFNLHLVNKFTPKNNKGHYCI